MPTEILEVSYDTAIESLRTLRYSLHRRPSLPERPVSVLDEREFVKQTTIAVEKLLECEVRRVVGGDAPITKLRRLHIRRGDAARRHAGVFAEVVCAWWATVARRDVHGDARVVVVLL